MLKITMPRGDLRGVSFSVADTDGTAVVDFDEIYFTVKSSYTDRNYLFQKRLSIGTIRLNGSQFEFDILPSDTDNLAVRAYVFDIEIVRQNEVKQTFVGDFVLTNEVTFAGNE